MIYESVINVSTSDRQILSEIISKANACIDVHFDIDHNRSVITIASTDINEVKENALSVIETTYQLIDLALHKGVHPRLGVVDVVPFISYDEESVAPDRHCTEAAKSTGIAIHEEFGVPIFYYDFACESNKSLPQIRKSCFSEIAPDLGGNSHERFGSLCVGAREPLIAINVNFDSDIALAKKIASEIRESSGGFNGVRAIGLELQSQKKSQISMNIVDTLNVDLQLVLEHILGDIGLASSPVIELVGLMPAFVFERFSDDFKAAHKLGPEMTVEHRLATRSLP